MIDALAVALAVRGVELQHLVHHTRRHARVLGAPVDFPPCDRCEVRYHRIDLKSRFLLDDGDDRAGVFMGRSDLERRERGVDVGPPSCSVGYRPRQ